MKSIKKTKNTVLNYRVIVEPDDYPEGGKCYTAYCPTLNVADSGDSVHEALKNIQEAIELVVDVLVEDGKSLPVDKSETTAMVNTKVTVSKPVVLS